MAVEYCLIHTTPIRHVNPNVASLIARARDRAFDLWHGIDSAGDIPVDGFTPVGSHARDATYYSAGDPVVLRRALSSLYLDFPRYTFIDLGSGKGRIVLVASRLPFRRVIGVEFVKEFHEIALANFHRWPASKMICEKITLKCEDAATFDFPSDPLVVYMFNPFGRSTMAQVMSNLAASIRERPRDVVILYVNPKQEKVVLETPGIHLLERGNYHSAYRLAAV
jgi:SAM-dependent methyltransferase